MPGMDGTGPLGQGPATGWGRGYCAAETAGRYGAGLGYRRAGRGFCRAFADERSVLEARKAALEESLEDVKRRLKEQ